MLSSLKSRSTLFIVLAALIAAFISAKPFAWANAWVIIPWGLLAVLAAWLAQTKKEALLFGALFGFTVSYAYLWFDDTSSYTLAKIVFLIFLILLPSAFGLLCGLLMSWLGWTIKTKAHRKIVR